MAGATALGIRLISQPLCRTKLSLLCLTLPNQNLAVMTASAAKKSGENARRVFVVDV